MVLTMRPHFDAAFYAREYRDVAGDAEALLLHFCERGWIEGRNPNAGFDTLAYLTAHQDVAEVGWNPFYHYVLAGRAEGRQPTPAVVPSEAAQALFGRDPGDWVTLLRAEVDETFYAAQAGLPPDGLADPVAHFAYRGWRDGLAPTPAFDLQAILAARADIRSAGINPLLAIVVERQAASPVPPPADPPAAEPGPAGATARGRPRRGRPRHQHHAVRAGGAVRHRCAVAGAVGRGRDPAHRPRRAL